MAAHADFTAATDAAVYFCKPHWPWQHGTNANMNGLLRQYLPRSHGLATVAGHKINQIATRLNKCRRATLGWITPAEKIPERLALFRSYWAE